MRTLKLTLAYDGTRFVGWQRQAEGESIQAVVEQALSRFEGAPVTVFGAGRTDAGVHALGQVAHACVGFQHDTSTLLRALNAQLPEDVRVMAVEEAAPEFHARFSARWKRYRYQLRHAVVASPFDRAYVWHLPERLDIEAMRRAADLLVGTHDFAAFQSVGTPAPDTTRTIRSSTLIHEGQLLVYEVEGDGFLRHMVRAIVGTLVEVGRGWRDVDSVGALLSGGTRADAGATAPARGLFLVRVDYD
jgi:tRNA pseudouridine38-40 synthase